MTSIGTSSPFVANGPAFGKTQPRSSWLKVLPAALGILGGTAAGVAAALAVRSRRRT